MKTLEYIWAMTSIARENTLQKEILVHINVLYTVQKMCSSLQDAGTYSCKEEMPCDEEYWVLEIKCGIEVVVIEDDA